MKRQLCLAIALCGLGLTSAGRAADSVPSTYDDPLAQRLGADARRMRSYVLVILRTGPTCVLDGKARDAMFTGHFANIQRLADAGKLVPDRSTMSVATGAGCSCSRSIRSIRRALWWRATR